MTVSITVRITEEQAEKIEKSGVNKSDYTRKAIDFYSVNKDHSLNYAKLGVIESCIELLQEYKKEVQNKLVVDGYNQLSYDSEENVRQKDEKLSYKNDENVRLSYEKEENVRQNVRQNEEESSYIFEENVRQMKENPFYNTFKPYLQLLSKMLNIHKSIPDSTKKKITNETATKPADLNDFIFNYKDEIKQIDYEISSEIVHHSYEEGSERKKI